MRLTSLLLVAVVGLAWSAEDGDPPPADNLADEAIAELREAIAELREELATRVASSRRIVAGSGIDGGGDLGEDLTLEVVADGETVVLGDAGLKVADGIFAAGDHDHDDRYPTRKVFEKALAGKIDRKVFEKALAQKLDRTAFEEILEGLVEAEALDRRLAGLEKALEAKAGGGRVAELTEEVAAIRKTLKSKVDLVTLSEAMEAKADEASVVERLAAKADAATMEKRLATKVDRETFAERLATKADAETTAEALATKADRATVDEALATKADAARRIDTGKGLAGGGDLASDRTLDVRLDPRRLAFTAEGRVTIVDGIFAPADHDHDDRYLPRKILSERLAGKADIERRIVAGPGLSGGGGLGSDVELAVEVDGRVLRIVDGIVTFSTANAEPGQVLAAGEDGGIEWRHRGGFATVDLADGDYTVNPHDVIVFVVEDGGEIHLPPAAEYPRGAALRLVSFDRVLVRAAVGEEIVRPGDGILHRRPFLAVGEATPFSRRHGSILVSDGERWYEVEQY